MAGFSASNKSPGNLSNLGQGVGVVIFLAIKRGGVYSKHDT